MAYVKTNWEDYPSTATAIDADALNHMEEGIYNNDQVLGGKLDNASPSFSGNMTGSGNVTVGGEVENGNGETLHGAYQSAENVLPIDAESGNPAVITDAFGGACKSIKLTLEPIQSGSGTPSPSNVRPISGRTEANVVRTGKNMWNDTDSMLQRMSRNGATYTNTETDTKTAFSARVELMLLNSPAYASTVATISSVGRYSIVVDATNITYDHFRLKHNGSVRDLIISLPFSVKGQLIISFDVDGYNPSVVGGLVIKNIQLENGSTATPYEPFDAQTITRTYGQTVYGAEDHVTGDGATNKFGYIEYDGSDDEAMSLTGNRVAIQCPSDSITNSSELTITGKLFSNRFVEKTNAETFGGQVGFHFRATGSHEIVLSLGANGFTTVAEWRTWLSQNPVQVIYGLATPTSIPLTSQNLPLLKGDNVITTDADSIEVSYSADIALYIAKKIAEGSQNNRSLSKGGSGDEEVKEEEKEEDPKEVEVNER